MEHWYASVLACQGTTIYTGDAFGAIHTYDLNGNQGSFSVTATNSSINDANGGLAVDASGNIFTGTSSNASPIQEFSSSGSLVTQWGSFKGTCNLGVDGSGNVYISDFASGTIYKYRP